MSPVLARRLPFAGLLLAATAASAANLGVKLPAAMPLAGPAAPPAVPASPALAGDFGYVTEIPAIPAIAAPLRVADVPAPGGNPAAPTAAPRAVEISANGRNLSGVGAAIAESKSVDEALANLVKTGALAPERLPRDATDRLYALERLWDHAAPAYAEGKISVDAGWAVPALRVESGGTTYLVHPVAHGQLYPPNKRAVTKLVRQIEARGEALYSEQNLPAHYAFSYGKETADHGVDEGRPIAVGPAANGLPEAGLKVFHSAVVATALAPLAWLIQQLAQHPSLAAAALVAAYLAFIAMARTGFLPFYAWQQRARAREAAKLGAQELAEQLRREAAALHKARLDPLEVLRLHLPPGPGAADDPFAARSRAMAQAIREDAAAAGAKVVHLLVGYKHAADIGWRLRSHLP